MVRMGWDAYIEVNCPRETRAAAASRVVRALASGPEVALRAHALGVHGDTRRRVHPDRLESELAALAVRGSFVVASCGVQLPVGGVACFDIRLIDDEYLARTRMHCGQLEASIEAGPFGGELMRPRSGPWPSGASDALYERRARHDVAWLVESAWRALGDAQRVPLTLIVEDSYCRTGMTSCAVHGDDVAAVTREYAIAWLCSCAGRRATELVAVDTDELRRLVETANVVPDPPPLLRVRWGKDRHAWRGREPLVLPRGRVLELLDADRPRVDAAFRAVAVLDADTLEFERLADDAAVLLANTVHFEATHRDGQRTRDWPSVPPWRARVDERGCFLVVAPPGATLDGFYAALATLLLET